MAAQRISGITIKAAEDPQFAVAHAERTNDKEPAYFLPVPYRLPNRIIYQAGTEAEIVALHSQRMEARTRQAKRANAPAFKEAVMVLPEFKPRNVVAYLDEISQRLEVWRQEFEKATGCTVVHMSVHLDEGHMENGRPHYNPHAHALIDRTLSNGHLWKPNRSELAKIQTLTAQALQMARGTTMTERKGKPARSHIPHKEYRATQEAIKAEREKADRLEIEKKALEARVATVQAKAKAAELYATLRGFLKGTGQAQQRDYQALKQLNDTKHPALQALALQIEIDPPDTPTILAELRHYWPASPAPRV